MRDVVILGSHRARSAPRRSTSSAATPTGSGSSASRPAAATSSCWPSRPLELGVEVVAVAEAAPRRTCSSRSTRGRGAVRDRRLPAAEGARRAGRRRPSSPRWPCDVVLNGITGVDRPARRRWPRCEAGRTLALANKESLIVGGPLVTARGRARARSCPVDSEHSRAGPVPARRHGRRGPPAGPDRQRRPVPRPDAATQLADVTPEQALAHPTWDMGPVVTINSATLVNKGLEVIEAHLLFDIPFERIDVVVHPQSVVHSMVEFVDGVDDRPGQPAGHAAADRAGAGLARPGARRGAARATGRRRATWTFDPLDDDAFPAVRLARGPGAAGGTRPGGLQRRERGVRRGLPRRAICRSSASSTPSPTCWPSTSTRPQANPAYRRRTSAADAWARRPGPRVGRPRDAAPRR